MTASTSSLSLNDASQPSTTGPAIVGAGNCVGTSTVGIDISLIPAASGGRFSTQPAARPAANPVATNRRRIVTCGQAMFISMPQADVVLDDHVVEIRRRPNQHFPNQVKQRDMF